MRHHLTTATLALLALSLAPAVAGAQEPRVPELRDAARQSPRDFAAQSAYGRALLRAGRFAEAQRVLRAASQLRRDDAEAAFDAVRPIFASGNFRASERACRSVARVKNAGAWGHVCSARAFLVWNRSARAFESLEQAIAADPNNFEAQLALGDAHRLRAAVADAEVAYRRATAIDPRSAQPHLGLGRLYLAARRDAEGIGALRRALELDADDPEIQYELGARLTGEERLRLLRAAVAGRPTWSTAQAGLGDALMDAGDHAGARAAFETAIRHQEDLAAAHTGLGRALTALGEHEAAEAALARAAELVPNSPATGLALAQLYAASGRRDEAFRQYRATAGLDPLDPTPMLEAAALALSARRDVLASGFLDHVLERHPSQARALALYGDVMVARSDRAAARDYYQRALRGQGRFDRARVQAALRQLGD